MNWISTDWAKSVTIYYLRIDGFGIRHQSMTVKIRSDPIRSDPWRSELDRINPFNLSLYITWKKEEEKSHEFWSHWIKGAWVERCIPIISSSIHKVTYWPLTFFFLILYIFLFIFNDNGLDRIGGLRVKSITYPLLMNYTISNPSPIRWPSDRIKICWSTDFLYTPMY